MRAGETKRARDMDKFDFRTPKGYIRRLLFSADREGRRWGGGERTARSGDDKCPHVEMTRGQAQGVEEGEQENKAHAGERESAGLRGAQRGNIFPGKKQ